MLGGSDCVIVIGVVRTDLGTGFWTERINPKSRILIDPDGVRMRFHRYDGLAIRQVVVALVDRLPASDRPIPRFSGSSIPQLQPEDGESSGARVRASARMRSRFKLPTSWPHSNVSIPRDTASRRTWGIAGLSRWSCAPRSFWPPVITPRWASPGRARWERAVRAQRKPWPHRPPRG